MTWAIVYCLGAYLLGSFPTGLVVGRARGVDVRTVGSGNIGATNVARALGKGWAALVLACDALKGFLDGSLEREQAAEQIAGHYLRFIQVYEEATAKVA